MKMRGRRTKGGVCSCLDCGSDDCVSRAQEKREVRREIAITSRDLDLFVEAARAKFDTTDYSALFDQDD